MVALGDYGLQLIADAARRLTEADYFGVYDPAHASFIFRPTHQNISSTTVPERDLSIFIRSASPPAHKLFIVYHQGDFPAHADKSAFESRVRSEIEVSGATVTFAGENPEKSLFP